MVLMRVTWQREDYLGPEESRTLRNLIITGEVEQRDRRD